jgi:hypothetical protein
MMASCTRLAAFSLARILETCALTVASLMYSRVAMSALDLPRATSAATSRSRSVSVRSACCAAARRGAGASAPNCSMSVRVTAGESMASPAATSRIAWMMSAGGVSFSRNPLAPARSAPNTYSSRWKVVSTITFGGVSNEAIRSVAVIPFTSGMRTSMSTTSGW